MTGVPLTATPGTASGPGDTGLPTTTWSPWFGMSLTRTIIDDTIYYVNGSGEASVWNTCGEFIYCT